VVSVTARNMVVGVRICLDFLFAVVGGARALLTAHVRT
jgi:hypothetical protein